MFRARKEKGSTLYAVECCICGKDGPFARDLDTAVRKAEEEGFTSDFKKKRWVCPNETCKRKFRKIL